MRDEQTRMPLMGSQILLLVVLAVLAAVFVVQLGLRAGRWSSDPQESDSGQIKSPVEVTGPARQKQASAGLVGKASADLESDVPRHLLTGVATASKNAELAAPLQETRGLPAAYTVQVGAFGSRSAAERVADRLKARGYSVRVEPPPPGEFYLVWVGSFQNGAEAENFARRIFGWLGALGLDGYRVRMARR